MKSASRMGFIIFAAIAALLVTNSFFIVDETDQAIVLQFGEERNTHTEPGLKFKLPFIQNVQFYDKRVLNLDPEQERFLLSNQDPLNVDYFVRYRIADPLEFFKTVGTQMTAERRLESIVNAQMREVLGRNTLTDVLSSNRRSIIAQVSTGTQSEASNLGIEVLEVRIGKADLPEEISERVFQRMVSERQEVATAIRAEGSKEALEIRATAERDRTVILAEANRESSIMRGQGEAERTRLLNEAQGADPEFFEFLRSLEAYRGSLSNQDQPLIITTDHPFLREFGLQE